MLDRLHALIKQEKEEKEKSEIKLPENNIEGGDRHRDEPGKSPRHFAVLASGESKSLSPLNKSMVGYVYALFYLYSS